jgi:class 3 adenylate cyclase
MYLERRFVARLVVMSIYADLTDSLSALAAAPSIARRPTLVEALPAPSSERLLLTLLFTDIVGSTELAVRLGDSAWLELLEQHDSIVRREVDGHGGRELLRTGDGVVATFASPGRAIEAACKIRSELRDLGIEIRAGLHTGECELRPDGTICGVAVSIGARVQALAAPDEVLVSSTVKEVVTGSGLGFADRGEHALKGLPAPWRLYAVAA